MKEEDHDGLVTSKGVFDFSISESLGGSAKSGI
jgi:hypothetical protein